MRTDRRIFLMAGLALAGCTPRAPLAERDALVRGQVTFRGKPVTLGKVTFLHSAADPVFADIGLDGRYELRAIVGSNMVAIECRDPDRPNADAKAKRSVIPGKSHIPV